MTRTTEVSAMNKAEIIAELENMVAARLFSDQPWLADREACVAIDFEAPWPWLERFGVTILRVWHPSCSF